MDKLVDFTDESLRDAVCERLCTDLGLHFPPERWSDLRRRVTAAAPELGYGSFRDCLQGLLADRLGQREMEVLASHLTVGETYFFRDPEIFSALEQQLLPDLIRCRRETTRRIRIWSVGCSSGEEAYSIAMTLAALLPDLEQWNVSVLASDINPKALAWGREGVYGNWSFRNPLPLYAQRCFLAQAGGRRAVVPRIKSLVSFAYLNLMDANYPAIETNTNAMDLVFCRNVLMYFHPQRVPQVLVRLADCLLEGGRLVVSPVENSLVENSLVDTLALTPCRLPQLVLFQKGALEAGSLPLAEFSPFFLPPESMSSGSESLVQTSVEAGTEEPFALAADSLPAAVPTAPSVSALPPLEALVRRTRELANRGLLAEALACCDELIARDKLDPAWAFLRASVLLELGELEAAATALHRSLYLDHDFVMAHFALANLLLGLGRRKEGRKHYRNALELTSALAPGQVLAEADGMSAGRLREIIEAALAAASEAKDGANGQPHSAKEMRI
ncbi:MAG: protein-glutamate O-methyltransferase CheR [Rhodocyclaceae bacterium]|nr:MAG: protein-glutamate O-methyltransferase CheR [Rhodocyclaceae bacterium]